MPRGKDFNNSTKHLSLTCWNDSLSKLPPKENDNVNNDNDNNDNNDNTETPSPIESLKRAIQDGKDREQEENWNDDPAFQSPLSIKCLEQSDGVSVVAELSKEIWLFHVFSRLDAESLLSISSVNSVFRSWVFYQPSLPSGPLRHNLWVSEIISLLHYLVG